MKGILWSIPQFLRVDKNVLGGSGDFPFSIHYRSPKKTMKTEDTHRGIGFF